MTVDLSRVSSTSIPGRLLRLPLSLLPQRLVVPIFRGPLAGSRWIVGAATHGCWLGLYELEKQRAFALAAKDARVVLDIGANVGFYTLLSARVSGSEGRVFAFEPLPRNLEFLERHIQLNHLTNIKVLPMAVADRSGTAQFRAHQNPAMGSVSAEGDLTVSAASLDDLSASGAIPDPDLVKIDVEGGEEAVLAGAERLVRRCKPTIFLATHGPDIHERCKQWLVSADYSVRQLGDGELIATPDSARGL